jgi:hypothetical protein
MTRRQSSARPVIDLLAMAEVVRLFRGRRTRRRAYRRKRTRRVACGVLVALVLLVVASPLLHFAALLVALTAHPGGVLVLLAATGAAAYRLGLNRRPVARATITAPNTDTGQLRQQVGERTAEGDQLRAELSQARADARELLADCDADLARMRAELDGARASATAAWDQAASRPPRRPAGDTAPRNVLDAEQLAMTPMSGARSLFGGRT